MSAFTPAVDRYHRALDRLRGEGKDPRLLREMSELVSLLDLSSTLDSSLPGHAILDAVLQIVMREMELERGALFVRGEGSGEFEVGASRGLPPGAPPTLAGVASLHELTVLGPGHEERARHGLALLCPISSHDRPLAVLGLGPRPQDRPYGPEEQDFLRSVAACAALSIENGLVRDELRRVNQELSVKVFQLRNLFDVGRELTGRFEEEAIASLVATTVMGHFVVSRCALYLLGPRGLALVHERGVRREADHAPIPLEDARAALKDLLEPAAVADLPEGPLRRRLEDARLALAVPLAAGARVEGVLAIGERASRTPFSEPDRDFALTLARQAFAALENARLNQVRVEKKRQDHELQVAREIQHGLFPSRRPEVRGFQVAAESRSCYEVGGDGYDWIPLGNDRLALVVADVSGKGTPASLLMASVHAYVQALAGTAPPAVMLERLNRFLFARTQAGRFVTLFYAELDTASRRLDYVNAGHVPPYRVGHDGTVTRLEEGGLALGLLDAATYETGRVTLEPGDTVAMVTDGLTEADSPDEREFGDERLCDALRALSGRGAPAVLEGLLGAVTDWAGSTSFRDDLTALILTA